MLTKHNGVPYGISWFSDGSRLCFVQHHFLEVEKMVEGIKKAHFVMGVSATPEGRWLIPIMYVSAAKVGDIY